MNELLQMLDTIPVRSYPLYGLRAICIIDTPKTLADAIELLQNTLGKRVQKMARFKFK